MSSKYFTITKNTLKTSFDQYTQPCCVGLLLIIPVVITCDFLL